MEPTWRFAFQHLAAHHDPVEAGFGIRRQAKRVAPTKAAPLGYGIVPSRRHLIMGYCMPKESGIDQFAYRLFINHKLGLFVQLELEIVVPSVNAVTLRELGNDYHSLLWSSGLCREN